MLSNNAIYVIEGILLGGFVLGVIIISLAIVQNFKRRSTLKSFIKQNEDRIKKFKEDGGIHSWVNIAVRLPNGKIQETHVCQHTGYCPVIDGFVDIADVKNIVRERKIAQEFEEFKSKRLEDLADEYCVHDINGLYKKMIGIKKDFHLQKIEKELGIVGKNIKIISNMEELEQAFEEIKDGKS